MNGDDVISDSPSYEVAGSDSGTCSSSANDADELLKPDVGVNGAEEKLVDSDNQSSNRKKRPNKRKEDQFVAQALKGVAHLKDPEEKLKAIIRRSMQYNDEVTELKVEVKSSQKRFLQLTAENDKLRVDFTKNTLTRQRLEEVCRQLQRNNKALKDEMVKFQREDEERRKEVTTGFQNKIGEINTLINDHNEKNVMLKKQNIEIRERLDEMVSRYAQREDEVNNLLKAAEAQAALAEAKIARAERDHLLSRELYAKEKDVWLKLESGYKAQIKMHEETEKQLKEQIDLYSGKYKEFHDAFNNFQGGMNETMKQIANLEKESKKWKDKYESAIVMIDKSRKEKEKLLGQVSSLTNACERLKLLCRAVTDDRSKLRALVKVSSASDDLIMDEWDTYVENALHRLKDCRRAMSVAACPNCSQAAEPSLAQPSDAPVSEPPKPTSDLETA